jgi:hypothetical protein
MALQDRASQRRERQLITECPVCGEDLEGRNKRTAQHFYTEHLPEDFGLTPLGEIREDTVEPLFDGSDSVDTPSAEGAPSNEQLVADGGTEGGERA